MNRPSSTLLLLACLCPPVPAQTAIPTTATSESATPTLMLEAARRIANMEQADTPPFRLQATIDAVDYRGKPLGSGTLEVLHGTGRYWKESVTFNGKAEVSVIADGNRTTAMQQEIPLPYDVRRVFDAFLDPVPDPSSKDFGTLLTGTKTGPVILNCVLRIPDKASDPDPSAPTRSQQWLQPESEWCFSQGTPHLLRAAQKRDGELVLYNSFVRFGPQYFAEDIILNQGGKFHARLHVTSISAAPSLTAADFVAPTGPDWPEVSGSNATGTIQKLPPMAMKASLTHRVQPTYPDSAKQGHIQGNVVLHAVIAKDGTVQDLTPLSSPDDSLTASALDAVRRWRYKPSLVNGSPVDVDATITVNYAFPR